MSYILEALRKAERERSLGQVPSIDHAASSQPGEPRRVWPWLLATALLVNAGVLAFWLMKETGPAGPQPLPKVPEAAVLTPTPAPSVADYLPPPTTVIDEPISEPPVARAPILSSSPPVHRDVREPEPEPAYPVAEVESRIAKPKAIEQDPVTEETPVAEEVPQLRDMPPEFRRSLPEMKVDAHFFTTVPGRSFVMINLSKYKAGERLAEGPMVDEIAQDGVVLSYQGRRFLLTP